MFRIEADVLIPGRGDPIKNAALVVDGTVIAYAGPIEGAPSAAGATVANVPALMPGMWDVHGHFMGIRTLNVEEIARTPLAVLASRSTKDAEVAVSAGFTSIRELSGLGVHLARVVAEGTVRGPHIYGASDDYKQFSKKIVIQRILRENRISGERLLAFGDGYVEIENTKEVGGLAVAVASDEANNGSGRYDEWKRERLLGVGADVVIPDFRDAPALLERIFSK